MLSPDQAQRLAGVLLDDAGASSERPGQALPDRIADCRIIRLIGSGGMGDVFEAVQGHPHRTVAVKLLRPGLMSRSAMRRFSFESDILGHLQHPGIAQVFEAGTYDDGSGGRPYFVMEFIPGARTITQFADEATLKLRQRLELFAQVCDAVHHGHQKGIIHRDLKPDNILVPAPPLPEEEGLQSPSPHGRGVSSLPLPSGEGWGEGVTAPPCASEPPSPLTPLPMGEGNMPQPKIIDFGVARATDADLTLATTQTDVNQLVGTLQYMSPEQCEGNAVAGGLDIRTDVYSLGVVLYELLTGRLPYDVSHKSLPSATRTIQDTDPPAPSSFATALRGNLDAIILKAIAKDRTKRYQSTAELATDIRAHLVGDPITARPPTRWSRAIRWVSRHPVGTTVAMCATILLVTVASSWLSVWLLLQRPYDIELAADGREARLISVAGARIHWWRTESEGGITFAKLLDNPDEFGGGKLAIIGYSAARLNPEPGSLCAFEMRNLDKPKWHRRITDEDIANSPLPKGQFAAAQFGVSGAIVADIFTLDSPIDRRGDEVVVVFKDGPASPSVIRVYDLQGERLCQWWHDGTLTRPHWMSAPALLALGGLNSDANWKRRGYPEVKDADPIVVFALRPKLGCISDNWIGTVPHTDPASPVWYRCLFPPSSSDTFLVAGVGAPYDWKDASRLVQFSVQLRHDTTTGFAFLIDDKGVEVPNSRGIPDTYKRLVALDEAPDPELFKLTDLPPIIVPAESKGPAGLPADH